MTTVSIDVSVALVAVQAVNERLPALRVRAEVDPRWAPEVERLEGARAALDSAINASLTVTNPDRSTP
ncbi:MAG: hypothetical protein RLZZ450_5428 [Pseudomonadota bacterium]